MDALNDIHQCPKHRENDADDLMGRPGGFFIETDEYHLKDRDHFLVLFQGTDKYVLQQKRSRFLVFWGNP